MCVIICLDEGKPKEQMLKDAELTNRDGGGVAWVGNNGKVNFIKGISAQAMYKLFEVGTIKAPAIIHFRIGTVGENSTELCHPFIVSKKSEIKTCGQTDKVLFHNGHWQEYKTHARKVSQKHGFKMPKGPHISDSRMMAYIAHFEGEEELAKMATGQKIAILTKDGIKRLGTGWPKVEGLHCSNNLFDRSTSWEDQYYYKGLPHSTEQEFTGLYDEYGVSMLSNEEISQMSDDDWYSYCLEMEEAERQRFKHKSFYSRQSPKETTEEAMIRNQASVKKSIEKQLDDYQKHLGLSKDEAIKRQLMECYRELELIKVLYNDLYYTEDPKMLEDKSQEIIRNAKALDELFGVKC